MLIWNQATPIATIIEQIIYLGNELVSETNHKESHCFSIKNIAALIIALDINIERYAIIRGEQDTLSEVA